MKLFFIIVGAIVAAMLVPPLIAVVIGGGVFLAKEMTKTCDITHQVVQMRYGAVDYASGKDCIKLPNDPKYCSPGWHCVTGSFTTKYGTRSMAFLFALRDKDEMPGDTLFFDVDANGDWKKVK